MVASGLEAWLPTSEAARSLGVTRQRVAQLVASGALRSRRVGNQFLVRREDVEARSEQPTRAGRPFSSRRAWALILLASDRTPTGVDASTVSKLRSVLQRGDLWSMRSRFRLRAERLELHAHVSDLARLTNRHDVVRTGARHAHDAGIGLVAPEAPVQLYVDASTAQRLQERFALRPSDDPNVILHVVTPEVRDWLTEPVAPRVAVALDLADDRDPRSRAVAQGILAPS